MQKIYVTDDGQTNRMAFWDDQGWTARAIVTPKTREHEKHAAHHNQCRAALSGGSWRKTVYEMEGRLDDL